MAAHDLGIVERKFGIDHVATNHVFRFCEIMLVVAVRAAKRDDCGDSVATASCPPGALLIVRATRRHIAQCDPRECADINTDLHSRRARKHIDSSRSPAALAVERYVLKEQFILFRLRKHVLISGARSTELYVRQR